MRRDVSPKNSDAITSMCVCVGACRTCLLSPSVRPPLDRTGLSVGCLFVCLSIYSSVRPSLDRIGSIHHMCTSVFAAMFCSSSSLLARSTFKLFVCPSAHLGSTGPDQTVCACVCLIAHEQFHSKLTCEVKSWRQILLVAREVLLFAHTPKGTTRHGLTSVSSASLIRK